MEDFDGAKFYCPHALADGNQHIQITGNCLQVSWLVFTYTYYMSREMALIVK